jgi:hypothetical protein
LFLPSFLLPFLPSFFLSLFLFFFCQPYYLAQADLELLILLLTPKCWDYKFATPHSIHKHL